MKYTTRKFILTTFMTAMIGLSTHSSIADELSESSERLGLPTRGGNADQAANRINISEGGEVCYLKKEDIILWRKDAHNATWITIQNPDNEQEVRLAWAANEHSLAWPIDKLPIDKTADYVILNKEAFIAVTLYPIPAILMEQTDKVAKQKWMQKNNCFWKK
jgi:hypothetical protein